MIKYNLIFFVTFVILLISCQKDNINKEPEEIMSNIEVEVRQLQFDFEPLPCSDANNIKIFVSEDCFGFWLDKTLDAMDSYNETNTSINMTRTLSQNEADISIDCSEFSENYIGIGEVPSGDGTIGSEIFLNTLRVSTCNDPCYYLGFLMGVLGNSLGVAWNSNIEGQNTWSSDIIDNRDGTFTFNNEAPDLLWIDGTSLPGTIEENSVFQRGYCDLPFIADNFSCLFSANDLLALETLYPLPNDPCDCPEAFDPCDCIDETDLPCDCPEYFQDVTESTCYCVCEYFDSFKDEWIEYRREEVPCFQNVSCESFTASTSRCTIEIECQENTVVVEDPNTGCSFCPCTTDSDCASGFTCQSAGGGSFQICMPK